MDYMRKGRDFSSNFENEVEGRGSKQNDIMVLWKFSLHLVCIYIMFLVEQKDFIARRPSFLVSSDIIDLASDIELR